MSALLKGCLIFITLFHYGGNYVVMSLKLLGWSFQPPLLLTGQTKTSRLLLEVQQWCLSQRISSSHDNDILSVSQSQSFRRDSHAMSTEDYWFLSFNAADFCFLLIVYQFLFPLYGATEHAPNMHFVAIKKQTMKISCTWNDGCDMTQ